MRLGDRIKEASGAGILGAGVVGIIAWVGGYRYPTEAQVIAAQMGIIAYLGHALERETADDAG